MSRMRQDGCRQHFFKGLFLGGGFPFFPRVSGDWNLIKKNLKRAVLPFHSAKDWHGNFQFPLDSVHHRSLILFIQTPNPNSFLLPLYLLRPPKAENMFSPTPTKSDTWPLTGVKGALSGWSQSHDASLSNIISCGRGATPTVFVWVGSGGGELVSQPGVLMCHGWR